VLVKELKTTNSLLGLDLMPMYNVLAETAGFGFLANEGLLATLKLLRLVESGKLTPLLITTGIFWDELKLEVWI
jgi:hypothetical protein